MNLLPSDISRAILEYLPFYDNLMFRMTSAENYIIAAREGRLRDEVRRILENEGWGCDRELVLGMHPEFLLLCALVMKTPPSILSPSSRKELMRLAFSSERIFHLAINYNLPRFMRYNQEYLSYDSLGKILVFCPKITAVADHMIDSLTSHFRISSHGLSVLAASHGHIQLFARHYRPSDDDETWKCVRRASEGNHKGILMIIGVRNPSFRYLLRS